MRQRGSEDKIYPRCANFTS